MAFTPVDSARQWWLKLRPEQKRKFKLASIFVGVGLTVYVGQLLFVTKNPNIENQLKRDEQLNQTTLLPSVGNASLQDTQDQVQELNNTVSHLQTQLTQALAQNQIGIQSISKTVQDMQQKPDETNQPNSLPPAAQQEINGLKQQLSTLQQQMAAQTQENDDHSNAANANDADEAVGIQVSQGNNPDMETGATVPTPPPDSGTAPPRPPAQVMTVSTNSSGASLNITGSSPPKPQTAYLPAGSILTGVLINGIDVSTASDAQSNPEAALVRLKTNSILPNRYRMNLIDCNVLVSGYGDLADSRAVLRANLLSCVNPQGGVISVPLEAYVVGPDGLTGVPGTVISHQGALITKSFLAGILSGVGSSAQSTQEPVLNVNPGGTQGYQSPDYASVGRNAGLSGVSQGANNVSQFYLKEAEALAPVVQVNPGVAVNLITIKGVHLNLSASTQPNLTPASDVSSNTDGTDGDDQGDSN